MTFHPAQPPSRRPGARAVSLIAAGADDGGLPTAERLARARERAGVVETETVAEDPNSRKTIKRLRFRDTCPLDAYHARGRLTDRQHAAGTWLARVFYRACLAGQSLTMDYSRFVVKTQAATTPIHDARLTFWTAMKKSGLGEDRDGRCILTAQGRLARDVCGLEEAVKGGVQYKMLATALDRLAGALGLPD